MGIRVEHVTKKYRDFTALDDVSLTVGTGELVALLGPSGSGKTTLLRIIAGLDAADSGQVWLDLPQTGAEAPDSRRVGFVFQHYALFRHMTVFDNVAFGLRMQKGGTKPDKEYIHKKVMGLLDLVHLTDRRNRYPGQLSGGQRQRVALARTLAVDPKVLLLDEPFGALDSKVRKELRRWLRKLHEDLRITTIFVTHDQEEAMELADRVAITNNGKIEQAGPPAEIYHSPSNAFVYDFMGNFNTFNGWRNRETGNYRLGRLGEAPPEGMDPVQLFARPHDMDVAMEPQDEEAVRVRIIHINPAGPLVTVESESLDGRLLQAALAHDKFSRLKLFRGQEVYLKPREVIAFDRVGRGA